MSVKSTVNITRCEAEKRYADLKAEKARAKAWHKARAMDDVQLEDKLEALNDEANDGEGYENYLIRR